MALVSAAGSALAYAVAMVLQQRSAQTIDAGCALRPGLVLRLIRRPWWLAGIVANLVGFGLRALALDRGTLALVQPIVVTGLVLALVIEAVLTGTRFTPRDAWAGLALVVGLSGFLVAAAPDAGRSSVSLTAWVTLAVVLSPAIMGALGLGLLGSGDRQARSFALAGGLLLALTAALTKQVTFVMTSTGTGVLRSWSLYALGVFGAGALLVTQSAFQTGSLRATLPVLGVVEPVTSIAIGAWLFQEQLQASPAARLAEVVALALLAVGVVTLTTGPLAHPAPRVAGGT